MQVSYELPVPARPLLLRALLDGLGDVLEERDLRDATRFGNLLQDCVAPWLATPRDVVRLVNAMRVGWPAVAREVDATDFLSLEALRLSFPLVHRAVRDNPEALCGTAESGIRRDGTGEAAARYDAMLLGPVPEGRRPAMRVALRRLFPRLDAAYANVWHGTGSARDWRRSRLVATRATFDAYFLLSPGDGAVTVREMEDLLGRLDDAAHVQANFRAALSARRGSDGVTRAALLLDEIRLRAEEVPDRAAAALLAALSAIADDLDVPGDDQLPGWGNQLRLWGLVQDLTLGRFDQERRSALLLDLAKVSQPHWLLWMAEGVWQEHQPPEEGESPREREPIATPEAAEELREATLEAIQREARTDALICHRKLDRLLSAWARLAGDGGAQARRWTAARLDDDEAVALLARAVTHTGESIGLGGMGFLGDRVATRTPRVNRAALDKVCDTGRLVERAEQLLAGQVSTVDRAALERFMEGWRNGRVGGEPHEEE